MEQTGTAPAPLRGSRSEVDAACIRAFVELKRAEGLNPATIRILVAILSALFTDLLVPILDRLLPVLADWKLRTVGEGRVIPPLRCDGQKIDKGTPGTYLRLALAELGLACEGSAGTRRRATPSRRSGS